MLYNIIFKYEEVTHIYVQIIKIKENTLPLLSRRNTVKTKIFRILQSWDLERIILLFLGHKAIHKFKTKTAAWMNTCMLKSATSKCNH